MNEYIFYTCEGCTIPPKEGEDVDNCQVLGYAHGQTVKEAKENLLKENQWIVKCGFDVDASICKQLLTDENKQDICAVIDYLIKDEQKHFQEMGKPKKHILSHTIKVSKGSKMTTLYPFADLCTTGIAANLLRCNFIGIDQLEEYLQLGIRRKDSSSI